MNNRADVVRDALLVVMAAGGGAFDAASYLRLHTFTANMTGNTVLLGLALGGRHLSDAEHSAIALAAFAVGACAGSALGRRADENDRWPVAVGRAFALEIVLVVALGALWSAGSQHAAALLALGAAAMGVQSAITHDLHPGGASSTYMTGTIARAAEFLGEFRRAGFRGGLILNGANWVVYFAAAIGVGVLDARGSNIVAVFWCFAAVSASIAVVGRRLVNRAALS